MPPARLLPARLLAVRLLAACLLAARLARVRLALVCLLDRRDGRAVATAMTSLAQQPDASATITRTLFVGLAMIESTAIYCFVVSMILIFANPFWNHFITLAGGK